MGIVNAAFKNNYGESRLWVIWDPGRDPNAPAVIFNDYLDADQTTPWLTLHTEDVWARAIYQRSDGAATVEDTITEGSVVNMS